MQKFKKQEIYLGINYEKLSRLLLFCIKFNIFRTNFKFKQHDHYKGVFLYG